MSVDEIMTLKKIDLFEYDLCQNEYLKEDMDRYGKKSINRYRSYCRSLDNLAHVCSLPLWKWEKIQKMLWKKLKIHL